MSWLLPLLVVGSSPAEAAPSFPIELEGEVCLLGFCVGVEGVLQEDRSFDSSVGPGTWAYRRNTLRLMFADGSYGDLLRSGDCFEGELEYLGFPAELVLCRV